MASDGWYGSTIEGFCQALTLLCRDRYVILKEWFWAKLLQDLLEKFEHLCYNGIVEYGVT
jgi:hypothetical protein